MKASIIWSMSGNRNVQRIQSHQTLNHFLSHIVDQKGRSFHTLVMTNYLNPKNTYAQHSIYLFGHPSSIAKSATIHIQTVAPIKAPSLARRSHSTNGHGIYNTGVIVILPFIVDAVDVVRTVRPSNGGGRNDERRRRSARTYFRQQQESGVRS